MPEHISCRTKISSSCILIVCLWFIQALRRTVSPLGYPWVKSSVQSPIKTSILPPVPSDRRHIRSSIPQVFVVLCARRRSEPPDAAVSRAARNRRPHSAPFPVREALKGCDVTAFGVGCGRGDVAEVRGQVLRRPRAW